MRSNWKSATGCGRMGIYELNAQLKQKPAPVWIVFLSNFNSIFVHIWIQCICPGLDNIISLQEVHPNFDVEQVDAHQKKNQFKSHLKSFNSTEE